MTDIPSTSDMVEAYLAEQRRKHPELLPREEAPKDPPVKKETSPIVSEPEPEKSCYWRADLWKFKGRDLLLIANGGKPAPQDGPREGLKRKGGPRRKDEK